MYRLKILALCLCLLVFTNVANSKILTFDNTKTNQNYSIYSNDLNRMEMALFGRTYMNESDETRINRIETKLYGKTYGNYTLARRMKKILQDYTTDRYWAQNGTTYCSPTDNNSFLSKLRNTFVGQPMGYTPQVVEPSPYLNTYGPSYMRGYYGTNGWNSHNSYNPIYSGAGIHILD